LILWVPISPTRLDPDNPLSRFQAVINPSRPLSILKPTEMDNAFAEVARVIQQRLPELARPQKGEKPPADTATQLAPLADELVQLLSFDQTLQPRAPGKRASAAPSPDGNLVFVVMSFSDDMEPIYEGIRAAAASVGLEAKRAKDVSGDYRIVDKIMEMILSSRFVVVDLTHESPNVYFELGYARASGKTVITIARRETQIHFDVKDWTYIPYIDSRTLERDLRERLKNELQR